MKKTKEEKICPNCGYCPTCKRPMQTVPPWPTYPWHWFGPYYPYYRDLTATAPSTTWTWSADSVTANTIDTTTAGTFSGSISPKLSTVSGADVKVSLSTSGKDYGSTS